MRDPVSAGKGMFPLLMKTQCSSEVAFTHNGYPVQALIIQILVLPAFLQEEKTTRILQSKHCNPLEELMFLKKIGNTQLEDGVTIAFAFFKKHFVKQKVMYLIKRSEGCLGGSVG